MEILAPQPEDDRLSGPCGVGCAKGGGDGQHRAICSEGKAVAHLHQAARHEVHRWARQEACNEGVRRVGINLKRRTLLDESTILHDEDAVAHGHGLDLVMGNVDGGAA